MSEVDDALARIRALDRRGAYGEGAAYADALSANMRKQPEIALARTRARMRQGRMADAESALDETDLALVTAGQRLIMSLEAASLRIYRDVAIQAALADAEAAFQAAGQAAVAHQDRAEAERVHIRMLLIAMSYYEISAEQGKQAHARLAAVAQALENGGRTDEALAARLTHAQRFDDPAIRLDALAAFAERALGAQRPELAGEACLNRAEWMLAKGTAGDAIRAELDRAGVLFAQADHLHGPIDVQRMRARLAIERELAGLAPLEACHEAYRRLDFPRGALNVLMDLSQLAHERGETAAAATWRRESLAVAEEAGLGLVRDNFLLAQTDLLLRSSDYGGAIELCRAALAAHPSRFSAASYEQLLSSAYAFLPDYAQAHIHGRRALDIFLEIGARESASNAAMKLASDLGAARDDDASDAAEKLLQVWIERDERRGDLAAEVSKREQLAQNHLNRFFYSPSHRGAAGQLDAAEQTLGVAEVRAQHLPEREAAKRVGNLRQLRGQLCQARGDEAGVERAWRDALAVYQPAGLAMETANCRYILGALRLNHANQDLMAHFGEAETNLREALAYYAAAGMRSQAADSRWMLARLYANASPRVPPDIGQQMLDAALGHLTDAEADYDAIRRDYAVGSVLESQRGKHRLLEKSHRIYELALDITALRRADPLDAWHWTQRAKARALSDALGSGAVSPVQVTAALEAYPESLALVRRERELAARLDKAPPDERPDLRRQLDALRQQMAQDPHLGDYLELRTGVALQRDDLENMLAREVQSGRSCVCVDWVAIGDLLLLLAIRPGSDPQMMLLDLRLSAIRKFVESNLAETFRQTLRDEPELLRELDPLVAPLAQLASSAELLILSPTGPLHALPLHALEIHGEPLLARHPVVYCSSLSVLRHCLVRQPVGRRMRTAALFGDPNGDRDEAATLVERLGQHFATAPLTRNAVTRAAFADVVAGCDLVHFQGHARHDPREPLDSHLVLADGVFTARDVFSLHGFSAELVTLAACESAANVIATGDEPLGLIPAFLYAGANAVIATLWRVHRDRAARIMEHFYDALLVANRPIDKAQVLREAMLALRATPGLQAPYHWAPFVLHGDWRRRERPS